MSQPATAFPETFVDKLIKFVFDNIRNILISATLVAAGGAIFRFRSEMPLGETFNTVLAVLIGILAFLLLVANLIHGGLKILELSKVKRRWAFVAGTALLLLYFAAGAAVVTAVPRLQLQQLNQVSGGTCTCIPSNNSFKPTPLRGAA